MEIETKFTAITSTINTKYPQIDFLYLLDCKNEIELKVKNTNKSLNYLKVKEIVSYSFEIQKKLGTEKFEMFFQTGKKYVFVIELADNILLLVSGQNINIQPAFLQIGIKNLIRDNLIDTLPQLETIVQTNEGVKSFIEIESIEKARNKVDFQSDREQSFTAGVRTQKEILGSFSEFQKHIPESFIIFLPKDSISGDFYWFKKIGNNLVLVLGDCTGHGMEGGLMTVMGASLLKVLVNESNVKKPNDILELLHHHILEMGGSDSLKTLGMEMAICVYDLQEDQLLYSGANINLQSINKTKNGLFEIHRANRLVLGSAYHEDTQFRLVKIDNASNYDFFMYTDGVIDQLGGSSDRKLGRKTLFEVLEQLNGIENSKDKKTIIQNYLSNWRGVNEQTDDLTLISFGPQK